MKSDRVTTLLWVLAGAMGLGWIVNFGLAATLHRVPFDWRSAVDFPLVLLICITLILAVGRASRHARGEVVARSVAPARRWVVVALVLGLIVAGVLGGTFAPGSLIAGR